MKILLLEDTLAIAENVIDLLTEAGHTVTHCENGARGLEAIEGADFDLIISDVSMPEMDGLTFAVTARREGLQAPIYLYTGNPCLDQNKVSEAQVSGVFGKCELNRLMGAVGGLK